MAAKNKSGKGKGQGKSSRNQSAQPKKTVVSQTMGDGPGEEELALPPEENVKTAPEPELALPPDTEVGNLPEPAELKALEEEKVSGEQIMLHEQVLPAVENNEKAEDRPAASEAPPAHEPAPKATPPGGKGAKMPGPRLPGGISRRPMYAGNPYMPEIATVAEIIEETHNIRTLRLVLDDAEKMAAFDFQPGQVGQISVFGAGEATFVINSPPSQKDYLQFSIMKAGEVTDAIHRLSQGDKVGLRAPLGNYFPYESWKGKNVFFVGGGIGMAPIRVIMLTLLENKADYGKISLLYGARSPKDMAFSYELDAWKHNPDLDCTLCIDNPHEDWGHKVGLIPTVLEEINPSPQNTVAVLCGPPIMIRFTLQTLQKLGFEPQNIVTTLEKRMKCGIGICGRCNIGDRFVCVDGPVFTMEELRELPPDL